MYVSVSELSIDVHSDNSYCIIFIYLYIFVGGGGVIHILTRLAQIPARYENLAQQGNGGGGGETCALLSLRNQKFRPIYMPDIYTNILPKFKFARNCPNFARIITLIYSWGGGVGGEGAQCPALVSHAYDICVCYRLV